MQLCLEIEWNNLLPEMTKVKLIRIDNLNISHPPRAHREGCMHAHSKRSSISQASSIPILSTAGRFYLRIGIVPRRNVIKRVSREEGFFVQRAMHYLSAYRSSAMTRSFARLFDGSVINPPCQSHVNARGRIARV